MARAYSRDLRERVVRAVEGGLSRRRAASIFGVGIATVINWVRVWRDSGRMTAKPMGGDHHSRLKGEREWLLGRIAAVPDLTLVLLTHRDIAPLIGLAASFRGRYLHQDPSAFFW